MDHVRIDEGIKRGPKRPAMPVDLPEPAKPTSGKLQGLDVKAILKRYVAGETSTQIAQTLDVTRQGLAWWMRKHAEDDWRESQIIQAIERKERAQEAIDKADDALSLARAREQLRSAQWDLERVYSRIFAQKQEITHTGTPVLNISITSPGPIDITPAVQQIDDNAS
jgi:hypothetical protein